MNKLLKSNVTTFLLSILIVFQILIRDISLPAPVELFGEITGAAISIFVLQIVVKFILQKNHPELKNNTLFTLNISLSLYVLATVIIWQLF